MTEHVAAPVGAAQPGAGVLFLLGSSRGDGNTRALLAPFLAALPGARLIDLGSLDISAYDYNHRHQADDFSIVANAIDAAQVIVFVTPVYWYAMSAQMKLVFDRLTDLTETRKAIGKRLAGKMAFAIINGAPLPAGFLVPFEGTAGYFSMRWGGSFNAAVRRGELSPQLEDEAASFAMVIAAARPAQVPA